MHPKVALINDNGVILRTDMDSGIYPEDGERLDIVHTVHRIYDLEGLSVSEYMNTRVWDNELYQFVEVPERPNVHADWNGSEWVWDTEIILNEIRTERNMRIAQTDWALLPDSPLSEEKTNEILAYRQELRDLPSTLDMSVIMHPSQVVWPEHPSL
jgi:hypothetical protein